MQNTNIFALSVPRYLSQKRNTQKLNLSPMMVNQFHSPNYNQFQKDLLDYEAAQNASFERLVTFNGGQPNQNSAQRLRIQNMEVGGHSRISQIKEQQQFFHLRNKNARAQRHVSQEAYKRHSLNIQMPANEFLPKKQPHLRSDRIGYPMPKPQTQQVPRGDSSLHGSIRQTKLSIQRQTVNQPPMRHLNLLYQSNEDEFKPSAAGTGMNYYNTQPMKGCKKLGEQDSKFQSLHGAQPMGRVDIQTCNNPP